MCLTNLKSRKEVEVYKREQPKEFMVWKMMHSPGETQYMNEEQEPLLNSPGEIYKAGNYSEYRSRLDYKPGFHAFRTKKQAQLYEKQIIPFTNLILVKFKARPEWIKNIGKAFGIPCLVLSHIKVLKRRK